jgi:cell division septal protein FtsQ
LTEKGLRPLHALILLVFILSLSTVIVLICLHLRIFDITEIEVTGTKRITEKEVLKRSGLRKNESTIFFREKEIREEIKKCPWISEVAIKRYVPHKVTIQITEAAPFWLVVGEDGELLYMSVTGEILGKANFGYGLDFPVLVGDGVSNDDLLGKALEIRRLAINSEVLNLKEISEIHLDEVYGISVFTIDKRRVDFGGGNITEKWYKMEKIIKYTRKINLMEQYINISSEKQGIVDFKL